MDSNVDDDFWNISSSSGFNFDDEEEIEPVQDTRNSVFSSAETTLVLPIHSIISKTGLDLVLGDIKSTNQRVVPPIEETIKKMFNDQKYSLHHYQTLEEKILLLDAAIETLDGNIISKVILYMKNTLKLNLFHHQIAKRKIAIKHYANYLISNNQLQQLADMYMATGNSSNLVELFYLIGRDINNKELLHKKLLQYIMEHLQRVGGDEKGELYDHLEFFQWQIENRQNSSSVIEQLACLCKTEWTKNKNNNDNIMEFKKKLKIDDFSFEWVVLNTLASMELWPQIYNFFIKPNWLTKKQSLKSVINPELFVYGLSRHKPSKDILQQYLSFISDSDTSISLAQKLDCHKFVIHQYINQKNKSSLVDYKNKVPPQSEEYFLIEHALQTLPNQRM